MGIAQKQLIRTNNTLLSLHDALRNRNKWEGTNGRTYGKEQMGKTYEQMGHP